MTKRTIVIFISLILLIIIVIAAFLYTYTKTHNREELSDVQKFEQLQVECDRKYKQDTDGGIRILRYPCADLDIQRLFKQRYGYEYRADN